MSPIKCYLKCIENSHEPFLLEDGVEMTFGRGPDTKIKDSRCSRSQIKLKADYKKKNVKITQIGRNSCGLNGLSLKRDFPVTGKHGDRVEILSGRFIHLIEFTSLPNDSSSEKTSGGINSNKTDLLVISNEESKKTLEIEDLSEVDEPVDKRLKCSSTWECVDHGKLLVYTSENVKPSSLIAAYDLDGTIITTMSGGVFPKHINDWKMLNDEVIPKLKNLYEQSYKILIFTNQAGLSWGKQNTNSFRKKIENIVSHINLPIQVFISAGYSKYRKPAIGMWQAAMERNSGLTVDMTKSFYCGDAAGREENSLKKKDFSHSDLLFAKNLELNFETPEHHFLKKKMPAFKITVFDPKAIPCDVPLCEPSWGQVISNKLEVVILVGFPGSGKTHFAKTHLIPAGYKHISRDNLGTYIKCINAMTAALDSKQKVVIDNTNPDIETRKKFIDVAKNYTPLVRCFVMKTTMDHSKHNNKFRLLTDPGKAVSDIVIHTYANRYQEPTLAEGFTEILKINFWLTFKNAENEKLYKLFLLEK